jgi:predicted DNA-binding transcriptional regulator AlpA
MGRKAIDRQDAEYRLKREMIAKGLMRPTEVAQFLGKSTSTVYEMIGTGELPHVLACSMSSRNSRSLTCIGALS